MKKNKSSGGTRCQWLITHFRRGHSFSPVEKILASAPRDASGDARWSFARINGRGCRRFHWLFGMEPTPALKKELLLSVPLNIGHLLLGVALIWDSIWQHQHGINLACGEQKILIWPRHNIFQSGLNLGFWVLDYIGEIKLTSRQSHHLANDEI